MTAKRERGPCSQQWSRSIPRNSRAPFPPPFSTPKPLPKSPTYDFKLFKTASPKKSETLRKKSENPNLPALQPPVDQPFKGHPATPPWRSLCAASWDDCAAAPRAARRQSWRGSETLVPPRWRKENLTKTHGWKPKPMEIPWDLFYRMFHDNNPMEDPMTYDIIGIFGMTCTPMGSKWYFKKMDIQWISQDLMCWNGSQNKNCHGISHSLM